MKSHAGEMNPCEAKKPAVKRSESPGKKKPKKSPDSANMTQSTPTRPTAFMMTTGSRRVWMVWIMGNYAAWVPGAMDGFGSSKEKLPLPSETAKSMPFDWNPLMVRGSRLVTNMHVLPTRAAGSGK